MANQDKVTGILQSNQLLCVPIILILQRRLNGKQMAHNNTAAIIHTTALVTDSSTLCCWTSLPKREITFVNSLCKEIIALVCCSKVLTATTVCIQT